MTLSIILKLSILQAHAQDLSLRSNSPSVSTPQRSEPSTLTQSQLLIKEFRRDFTQNEKRLPAPIRRLLLAYPDLLQSAKLFTPDRGVLVWHDGEETVWQIPKRQYHIEEWARLRSEEHTSILGLDLGQSYEDILNKASLREQFLQLYPKGRSLPQDLPQFFEPGRLRDESFFKKMYGAQRSQVKRSLTKITWGKQSLQVTKVNRIDERLKAIHSDLLALKRFKSYMYPSAGAFHWRTIKGTQRLSVHSFGAAIDIAVKRSHYWRWTLKVYGASPEGLIPYKNSFPVEVIRVFERYGFIWGGWWYHHDTMHFEYRPELLVSLQDEDQVPVEETKKEHPNQ